MGFLLSEESSKRLFCNVFLNSPTSLCALSNTSCFGTSSQICRFIQNISKRSSFCSFSTTYPLFELVWPPCPL